MCVFVTSLHRIGSTDLNEFWFGMVKKRSVVFHKVTILQMHNPFLMVVICSQKWNYTHRHIFSLSLKRDKQLLYLVRAAPHQRPHPLFQTVSVVTTD